MQEYLLRLPWHGGLDIGSRHWIRGLRHLPDAVSQPLADQALHCIRGYILLVIGRRPADKRKQLLSNIYFRPKKAFNSNIPHMQASCLDKLYHLQDLYSMQAHVHVTWPRRKYSMCPPVMAL